MVFAMGLQLAERVDEHLVLCVAVMATVVLAMRWPKIARRIEVWIRRR